MKKQFVAIALTAVVACPLVFGGETKEIKVVYPSTIADEDKTVDKEVVAESRREIIKPPVDEGDDEPVDVETPIGQVRAIDRKLDEIRNAQVNLAEDCRELSENLGKFDGDAFAEKVAKGVVSEPVDFLPVFQELDKTKAKLDALELDYDALKGAIQETKDGVDDVEKSVQLLPTSPRGWNVLFSLVVAVLALQGLLISGLSLSGFWKLVSKAKSNETQGWSEPAPSYNPPAERRGGSYNSFRR